MSTTIRVSRSTRDRIAALAESTKRPMTAVVDEALDALERRAFFTAYNERYAELRNDEATWRAIEAERAQEASTLTDPSE